MIAKDNTAPKMKDINAKIRGYPSMRHRRKKKEFMKRVSMREKYMEEADFDQWLKDEMERV